MLLRGGEPKVLLLCHLGRPLCLALLLRHCGRQQISQVAVGLSHLRFVNEDYVLAELAALRMCILRYSLGHELPCVIRLCGLHHGDAAASWGLRWSDLMVLYVSLGYGSVTVVLRFCCGCCCARQPGEAVLWLPCQPGGITCLQFLPAPSHLLPASCCRPCLP